MARSAAGSPPRPREPKLQRDPFDRLLVAQARSEGMTLLTVDERLSAYGGCVRLLYR
jgi:PIN domain nuclease of toxin-antitoxin system